MYHLYRTYEDINLSFRKTSLLFKYESFWNLNWTFYGSAMYFPTLTRTGWLKTLFDKKSCVFIWRWDDFSFRIIAWFSSHTIPFWATCACKLLYLLPKYQGPIVCVFSLFLRGYLTYPHKVSLWLTTLLCFFLLAICFSISLVLDCHCATFETCNFHFSCYQP